MGNVHTVCPVSGYVCDMRTLNIEWDFRSNLPISIWELFCVFFSFNIPIYSVGCGI